MGIEKTLEDLLNDLDKYEAVDPARVKDLEKKKEEERRTKVRNEKLRMQEEKIETRLEAMLKRSRDPVHKKVGKQIMYRSPPLDEKKREEPEDDGYDEAMRHYELFEIWLNRHGNPV